MKMMILKPHYFKFSFLLLLISCKPLHFKEQFRQNHAIGKHSRALSHSGLETYVAGKDGVYSFIVSDKIILTDSVENAEDIRDLHLIGSNLLLLNSGNHGLIWKIEGDEKKVVYQKDSVFLDGFDFWDENRGIAYGDPVNGKMFLLTTENGGNTWDQVASENIPSALQNEAGFAASGTGVRCLPNGVAYISTGVSDVSRLLKTSDFGEHWTAINTPIKSGESYGIYSMYFWSEQEGMIIGGSYLHPEDNQQICYYTDDGGENWKDRSKGLGGYISCIDAYDDLIVVTGRMGTYYSVNRGEKWNLLFSDKFYSVDVEEYSIAFSGKNGAVLIGTYKF
ncbi:hypothetical protein K6119_01985 [Paracrocinitomix mangrovi]|uniref:WD40/YVTN/BNR-like repeat-containing protein n=1 Tax=Paracrocinitomix mangrovi TaxID=2862509 RepID=UPI001C8D2DA6|nr:hypothetical protein [Paracrocinitomix mangrovi]UKN02288.1 hypothetical protein K6119_01985 [Paracrocinitomix mangrovi]